MAFTCWEDSISVIVFSGETISSLGVGPETQEPMRKASKRLMGKKEGILLIVCKSNLPPHFQIAPRQETTIGPLGFIHERGNLLPLGRDRGDVGIITISSSYREPNT